MRNVTFSVLVLAVYVLSAFAPSGQVAAQMRNIASASQPPDYSQSADWVCRPGKEDVCTTNLDARVISRDGSSRIEPFVLAADPPIDCFYVYPTVSWEWRDYADLADGPAIQMATKAQVGRLSSKCRIFAPIYRQRTLKHLAESPSSKAADIETYPQDDIRNAWQYYLDHYNRGRGVVLIGHSQGSIVLQGLIQSAIDPDPEIRSRIVSIFLAGDPSLAVPPGASVGGTFKHIPVCSSASELGCVYVWGSYLGNNHQAPVFGAPPDGPGVSACRNPAAPRGGTGALKFYYENPAKAPAYIESVGQISGACEPVPGNPRANTFNVTVMDGPDAASLTSMLQHRQLGEKAGLHILDIALVQGNILDVLDAEIAAWRQKMH